LCSKWKCYSKDEPIKEVPLKVTQNKMGLFETYLLA
jgi:hypothetical protein